MSHLREQQPLRNLSDTFLIVKTLNLPLENSWLLHVCSLFCLSVDLFAYLYFPFHITFHISTVTEMGWNNVNTVFYYKSFGCMDSFFCMNKNFLFFFFFEGRRGNNPFTTNLRKSYVHTE